MTEIYKGATSNSLFIELVDSTTGLPKTAIVYTDVTGSYVRTRSARVAITMATLASAAAAFSSGGFILADDTNQPGVYRIDVPDAAFATGASGVVFTVKATGCRTVSRLINLVDINNQVAYVPNAAADAAGGIAATVWDRVLNAANHNIASSAGKRVRQLDASSILSGTAAAGATNSITLDGSASATNDIYDENLIVITGGTGAGQTRIIVEYNGTTKVAIVNRTWQTTPSTDSTYDIIAGAQADIAQHGLAQTGTASTITLSSAASSTDDIYIGSQVYLSTSTGTGQTRLITDYNGTTKVATVSPNWVTNPTSSSVYKIIPMGRTIVDSGTVSWNVDWETEFNNLLGAYNTTGVATAAGVQDVYDQVDSLITLTNLIPTAAENATAVAAEIAADFTIIKDHGGWLLAINAGAVASPQATASSYEITINGTVYTSALAGQTDTGVRTAPSLTKV